MARILFAGVVCFLAAAAYGECKSCCSGCSVVVDPAKAVIVASGAKSESAVKELKLHLKLVSGVDVPVAVSAGDDAFVFSFDTKELGDNSKACAWKATGTRRHPGEANESIFEDACGFSRLDNCVRL